MKANTLQNSKKNVAAIVAVSLVVGLMIGVEDSYQKKSEITETRPGAQSPKKPFGSSTQGIVCGDRLCYEPQQVLVIKETDSIGKINRNDPATPYAELINIAKYKASPNSRDALTYKITYRVTAGQENLKDIEIHAVTDMGVWDLKISLLNAGKSSVNVARLKAMDPDSITAEIIGYTIRN